MAKRRIGIPTREELMQLPNWAIVLFAARCAERVRPLADLGVVASDEAANALDDALSLLLDEEIKFPHSQFAIALIRVEQAAKTAHDYAARETARSLDTRISKAVLLASAAGFACDAVAFALRAVGDEGVDAAVRANTSAARATDMAGARRTSHEKDGGHLAVLYTDAARADFEKLFETAYYFDARARPIPAAARLLGSHWPQEKPWWWPMERTEDPETLESKDGPVIAEPEHIAGPLRVIVDPRLYDEAEVAEVMSLLSELYGLESGDRLIIDSTGTAAAAVLDPVSVGPLGDGS